MPPDAALPGWASGPGLSAMIRADDELTIVCDQERVPMEVEAERDWVCLRTIGPFDFQTTGVVQSLISPLSSHGIGIFVLCTFDGEHLLVPAAESRRARDLLTAAGHRFID